MKQGCLKSKFHHLAIVVDSLEDKTPWFYKVYAAEKEGEVFIDQSQNVKVQFIKSGRLKIELLEPLKEGSPISSFLNKHGSGTLHHIAFEVDDLNKVEPEVRKRGGMLVSQSKDGWEGMEVIFAVFFTPDKDERQIIEYIRRPSKKKR